MLEKLPAFVGRSLRYTAYAFQLFALDDEHEFEGHPGRIGLVNAMREHVIGRGVLIGSYQRR